MLTTNVSVESIVLVIIGMDSDTSDAVHMQYWHIFVCRGKGRHLKNNIHGQYVCQIHSFWDR